MRTKVAGLGFSQKLENPAQVEQLSNRSGIATFDPNTKPVENSLIPDSPKEKPRDVAESLLEEFDEQIVYFKATTTGPSAINTVNVAIADGPAKGYIWDVRRIVASFPLLLQEGTFTVGTLVYLYAIPQGQLPDNTDLALNILTLSNSWKYLCAFDFSTTVNPNGYMLEPYTFGRLQMTVRGGESLAAICVSNDSGNGSIVIEGQAVQIPEARLRLIR